jgi:hypothetical protein
MPRHGFQAAPHVHFLADILHVRSHRLGADAQFVPNLLVDIAAGEQIQHFPFARREVLRAAGSRAGQMKMLDDFARNGAGHWSAALGDIHNRFEQLRRRTRFDQITAGSGFQRPENALAVLIHRKHNNLQCG